MRFVLILQKIVINIIEVSKQTYIKPFGNSVKCPERNGPIMNPTELQAEERPNARASSFSGTNSVIRALQIVCVCFDNPNTNRIRKMSVRD